MAAGTEEADVAAEVTATDIRTGTKIMVDAITAIKTINPMGKPKV